MYWRLFGEIALTHLQRNLQDFKTCPTCQEKRPSWARRHACPKDRHGLFVCVDCGAVGGRANSKQCRCEECQKQYRKTYKANVEKARRLKQVR